MQQLRQWRRVVVVLALLVVLNEAVVLKLGALLLALEGEVVPLGDLQWMK